MFPVTFVKSRQSRNTTGCNQTIQTKKLDSLYDKEETKLLEITFGPLKLVLKNSLKD